MKKAFALAQQAETGKERREEALAAAFVVEGTTRAVEALVLLEEKSKPAS